MIMNNEITRNKITESLKAYYGNGSKDQMVTLAEHDNGNFTITGAFHLWYEVDADGMNEYTLNFSDSFGNEEQYPFFVAPDATFKDFVTGLCEFYNEKIELFYDNFCDQYPCNDGWAETENDLMTWQRI